MSLVVVVVLLFFCKFVIKIIVGGVWVKVKLLFFLVFKIFNKFFFKVFKNCCLLMLLSLVWFFIFLSNFLVILWCILFFKSVFFNLFNVWFSVFLLFWKWILLSVFLNLLFNVWNIFYFFIMVVLINLIFV